MARILGYGCTTAAGRSGSELWSALLAGRDPSSVADTRQWPIPSGQGFRVCRWQTPNDGLTARAILLRELLTAWDETKASIPRAALTRLMSGLRLGVVLATTKAHVDDFIWDESRPCLRGDNLTPLLDDFLRSTELSPVRKLVVSNACASSLSALFVARSWLASRSVDEVLVIAADRVGPFVTRGFECLRVLSSDGIRPFSADRSGFYLGEAAAAIVLSNKENESSLRLRGAGVDAEGFAITRPTLSGESLKRACLMIEGFARPDLIIAHGTGTRVNDQTEDRVYSDLFPDAPPLITGTKWCVGHTLGASGLIDVIAACMALKTKSVFRLATTAAADPTFLGRYLTAESSDAPSAWRRALVSSLGFGGVHAAVLIENPEESAP